MARRVDEVAAVVASLAGAAGMSVDPTSILVHAVDALEPVLPLGSVTLWRERRDGPELVASRPGVDVPVAADLSSVRSAPGAVHLPLEIRGDSSWSLVVHPAAGASLDQDDLALLDIAASQVAGALERVGLFAEVMELERMKWDFIARVSHELRTPITIINGFLETLIAHDGELDAGRRLHMLDRSRVAASRLGHLIEELLILSRLEGGVLIPTPEALVMADVLDTVRAAAAEPEKVVVVGPVDHPIVTDGSLLVRALSLIVDNAVKYGGVAELSIAAEGDRWVVAVRDRGPGFADDIRATIFEMFARSSTTTAVPGLGVGLPIARTVVEVLNGTITIDDADPGPGAVVRISLPA